MLVTTKISIDLQRPFLPVVINAVQGDQNTRCLEISLYSGGTAWPVPDGATVAMRYRKSDKTKGYYDSMPDGSSAWSAKGNVITMLLAPQMLTVAGPVMAQLEMTLGSSLLATFTMQINVVENPAAGVLQSEDYVNWLQWMEDELEVRMNEMLETGDFNGPPGPPPTILSQITEYQASADYKTEPTGKWSSVVPDVAQGEYLWTRTTVTYNSGSPVVSYSVARFGMDGSGSVSSVAGVSPDANGDVVLNAEDIKALPIDGGDMFGPINMNGNPISGLNAPTENTHAANKAYVDGMRLLFAAVSVPKGDFIEDSTYTDFGYRVAVPLSGVTEMMIPDVTFSMHDAMSGNFAPVCETYDGGVYLYASEVPESDLTVPTIICWR